MTSGDCEIDVVVEERDEIEVVVEERDEIAVEVSERDVIDVQIESDGMTPEQVEKLNSIDFGARARQPDLVKLAYAVEKYSGTDSDAGDSVVWDGTDVFQELIQFLVPAPAWRASGYLEFDFAMGFQNPSGVGSGAETISFEIQRANIPPTDPGVDPSLFGLPQSWTTVATFQTLAIPTGAGTGRLSLLVRFRANGHTGTAFQQIWGGQAIWSDLSPGEPKTRFFIGGGSAFDPTKDLLVRARFKADQPIAGTFPANQIWKVRSASCILVCPRDESGV